MDNGYEKILSIVGKKHDLIGVVINDKREREIPKLGLIKFTDAETGEDKWIDTSSALFQKTMTELRQQNARTMKSLFTKTRLDSIEVQTGEDYVKPLVQFFKMRERRW
jgi:hypothetical protein